MLGRTFSLFYPEREKRSKNFRGKKAPETDSALSRSKNRTELQSKIPPPPPLVDMLQSIIYVQPFSEVNKDILRLIRRVSLIKRVSGKPDEIIVPAEEERPEKMREHPKEGVYSVLILMRYLLRFFESPEEAEKQIRNLEGVYSRFSDGSPTVEFTVLELLSATGGDRTRTAYALRCIHQSVAISGHLHIKAKVCPYITKDVSTPDGWLVSILLSSPPFGFVQVCHSRRECSMESSTQSHNHWELQFKVFVTFDAEMRELTQAKLEVTDLILASGMDDDLETYLKKCFKNGKLVVC